MAEKKKENFKNPFVEMEEGVLDFWEKNKIFEKSLEKDAPNGEYTFYDGPPFATGLPHYGHLVASIMKDAIPRYWTMKGYRVERRWGWDCHGLPVENLAEKEMGLKNKRDIEGVGIEKFNNYCKSIVLRYALEWKKTIRRIGRWVDMENDYKTMNLEYTESIWWVFKKLWEKNLIYKDYKSMHICSRCGTTLSNFEVGIGYKEIEDFAVTVKFKLKEEDAYILAWTTTPWTLVGNVALAVGENISYVIVSFKGERYILAEENIEDIFEEKDIKVEKKIKGKDLLGKTYEPLFKYYFKDEKLKERENGWKIYGGNFVTVEEGTGVVHIAPAFGEDDMEMRKKYNLPFVQHIDMDGRFKKEVKEFAGLEAKPKEDHTTTDEKIISYLERKEKVFKKEKYVHSYPHCWRCETPLLNYATESWFVKVTKIKKDLLENNKKVNWVPEHVKMGRFGKWIEQARDWAISRNRYWGAPLPVWECKNKNKEGKECKNVKVVGSLEELEELSGKKIEDLHRPWIDDVVFSCEKCGGEMRRVPEVLDCWFESGSMPYAQANYTGNSLEKFDPEKGKNFPAQFVAEGMDQTRGWFYTLMVLSTALFDKPAFENVIVNGIVLAQDGQKMSKSKGNYPDPAFVFEKFGVDALRNYLLASPVLIGENLNFSEKGVLEVFRKNIMLLWNVVKFYKMFAEKENYFVKDDKENVSKRENILDRWITARMEETVKRTSESFENYNIPPACQEITSFIDDLSTWYIRRSRERFKGENREDAEDALRTTGFALYQIARVSAPIMPFIAESIFQTVTEKNFKDDESSVHLLSYPETKRSCNEKLLKEMQEVREVVSLGLKKRSEAGIKVRQPLSLLTAFSFNIEKSEEREALSFLIKEELNVKKVIFKKGKEKNVEIDTEITPELKEEGNIREITRVIQNMRKEADLVPEEKITLFFEGRFFKEVLFNWKSYFKKEGGLKEIKEIVDKIPENLVAQKEVEVDGKKLFLGIKRF